MPGVMIGFVLCFLMTSSGTIGAFNGKPSNYLVTEQLDIGMKSGVTIQASSVPKRPFEMPLSGERWSIFQPLYDMDEDSKNPQLFATV